MTHSRRWIPFVATLALVLGACGSNSGGGAAGSGAPEAASLAPAVSPADVSGELTVWAMGNEGAKLESLADEVHGREPGRQGQRDPGRLGPGGRPSCRPRSPATRRPDVSQMGTDMMGQFAETGALEPVPAEHRPGAVLRERLEHRTSSTARPTACRGTSRPACSTTGPTSPRRPASPTPPDDLGRAQGRWPRR